jgi:lipoic acid synthetase
MSVDKTIPITVVAEGAKLLGEDKTAEQVHGALNDLRAHAVEMVRIGQYLQPTPHHHPMLRCWTPTEFDALANYGQRPGFQHVASGPLVRSSYHTDRMAHEAGYVDVA